MVLPEIRITKAIVKKPAQMKVILGKIKIIDVYSTDIVIDNATQHNQKSFLVINKLGMHLNPLNTTTTFNEKLKKYT